MGASPVSGLVLNLGEFGVEPLMGPQMENFFSRLGLPQPGEGAMLTLAALALVLGRNAEPIREELCAA